MDIEQLKVDKDIKIVFMGTPEFSVPVLEGLIENYKVRAVVTQPDKKVGRDGVVTPSPVKQVAQKYAILVLQPEKIKEQYQEIIDLGADLIVTCAYGQIIPKEILDAPRLGCINVHASLLPKLRGGAPIHRAIMEGYTKTGITIMYMNEKMDAGDIISQREISIDDDDTASILHDKLKILGRDLLLETLPSIIDGTAPRIKQNEAEATYGFNIKREDEKIDFNKTSRQIYNQVRGLNSWPGAYCIFEGKILKIWSCYPTYEVYPTALVGEITRIYNDGFGVKTSNGEIVITELQLEGKRKMTAVEFMNGLANKDSLVGKILS